MKKIHQIEPLGINDELQNYYCQIAQRHGFEVKYWHDRPSTKQKLIQRCKGADCIILSNIPIDKEVLDALPDLKMISVAFTGLDHIDMEECLKREIIVKNAAGYSTTSVAELTIAMVLCLYRSIVNNATKTLNGEGRNGYTGTELSGKTVGIVGMGRIGGETARLFQAFGCTTIAWNRTVKKIEGVRFVSLETLLSNADIVSIH
ncbi:MAG TPA: NAD(P)-dependent oxidoreductase, partial [Salinivirgaceae bacterium]|nr:NAD(P)-dependent oxidoreductase [Salinivirgaceae bacterium]